MVDQRRTKVEAETGWPVLNQVTVEMREADRFTGHPGGRLERISETD